MDFWSFYIYRKTRPMWMILAVGRCFSGFNSSYLGLNFRTTLASRKVAPASSSERLHRVCNVTKFVVTGLIK
jgi:hypothetical protein